MQLDPALTLAFAALFLSILGPIVANFLLARQTSHERREKRRNARQEYLNCKLDILIELRAKLQYLQKVIYSHDSETLFREQQEIYGQAYGVLLSINDEFTRAFAMKIMLDQGAIQRNEKLDALDEAIKRVGDLVDQVMR